MTSFGKIWRLLVSAVDDVEGEEECCQNDAKSGERAHEHKQRLWNDGFFIDN